MARMQTDVIASLPVLTIDGLEITAARGPLVTSFDWTWDAGGIAWLIGENGTGKSSLLRVLAGRQRAKHGHVRWAAAHHAMSLYLTPSMSVPGDVRVGDWLDYVATLTPESPR